MEFDEDQDINRRIELLISTGDCSLKAVRANETSKPFFIDSESSCSPSNSTKCVLSADCRRLDPDFVHPDDRPDQIDKSDSKKLALMLSSAHQITFWSYLLLRIVFSTFSNVCFSLVEATCVVLCEIHKTDYGRQRLWAMLATGVFSPICGLLIDTLSFDPSRELTTDYSPAFYAFNFLVVFTIIFTVILDLEVCPPPKEVWKEIRPLLRSADIWVFLIVVLVSGTLWGFVENFLFW